MRAAFAFALLTLLAAAAPAGAVLLDKEVVFSEAEVQAAVDRRGPVERNYGGFVVVALPAPPRISLDRDDGRAGLAARVEVTVTGGRPVPVDLVGNAGIRYDDNAKAFYLANATVESLQAPGLPRELEQTVRQVVSQLLAGYFRTNPVHVLRADGSVEERAAHWLLRSVRIDRGRVVAVFSPL
ncbi:MAG: DUF1439 domain-containing protein [Betaproteobacteria bacterium]|nr:DUF1439 domain-containing protein [Betaproteobacteria bacterium]